MVFSASSKQRLNLGQQTLKRSPAKVNEIDTHYFTFLAAQSEKEYFEEFFF